MPITTGQSIALGNISSPERTHPFTDAIKNMQKLDLAREEQRAKKDAAKQKQQDLIQKNLYFGEGGFDPHFQEQASKIIGTGVQGQMDALQNGDIIGQAQLAQQTKNSLEDLKVQNENYKKFVGLKKEGYLIPQELENALGERYSTGNPKVRQFLQDNPQYNNIISIDDATGNYTYNPVKNIDLSKTFDTAIRENEGQMTESKFLRPVDKNTSLYELSLAPDQVTNIAAGLGSDDAVLGNVKIKYPQKFNQYQEAAKKEFPELPDNQIQSIAASKIIEEELTPRNRKTHFESAPQGDNNNITFNSGSARVGKNIFNYDVTDINQAQPALKEAGVIKTDQDINFLQGTADFPSISPPAIASGNIQDENGKSVFVDNVKMVYIPKNKEWYAMGNKDGNKKKQIAIPINEYTIGPVASLYKTDIDKLQSIMDSRLKQYSPKKSYSQNQTKAIDAFRDQLKREPNASELQKILQKYK